MTYKLLKSADTGTTASVLRKTDNAQIPFEPDNTDYQDYLKWVEAGNTAEAAD